MKLNCVLFFLLSLLNNDVCTNIHISLSLPCPSLPCDFSWNCTHIIVIWIQVLMWKFHKNFLFCLLKRWKEIPTMATAGNSLFWCISFLCVPFNNNKIGHMKKRRKNCMSSEIWRFSCCCCHILKAYTHTHISNSNVQICSRHSDIMYLWNSPPDEKKTNSSSSLCQKIEF